MEKQNHELRIKCSLEEHEKIKKKAEESGLTIKQYILHLALYSTAKIRVVVE